MITVINFILKNLEIIYFQYNIDHLKYNINYPNVVLVKEANEKN